MITLLSPKIPSSECKAMTIQKEQLESAINAADSECKCVCELRKKERKLEKERDSLNNHAAKWHRDSEIKLSATLKQLERVNDSILSAEAGVHERKVLLFRALDDAQEMVGKVLQASYESLLDQQADAFAPFWNSWHDARHVGRNSPAVGEFIRQRLSHTVGQFDSVELIDQTARRVLATIDAILKGSEIWSFEGAESSAVA